MVLAGVMLVHRSAPAQLSATQSATWGGINALVDPSSASNDISGTDLPQAPRNQPPYAYTLPTLSLSPAASAENAGGTAADSFDFDRFIATLTQGNAPRSAGTQGSSVASDAYAYIPTGLISTTAPSKRTKLQQALYEYGNAVGSLVQAFEQDHADSTRVLTNYLQDRNDSAKGGAVAALGSALTALGGDLLAMEAIPSQVSDAHQALAQSYQEIGKKLSLTARAQGDTAFLAAINTYNDAAGVFIGRYVAIAQLFVAYGVSFSPNEPGNVFTFTNASL